ncbi:Mandelate racemase/muconate lactonizing enzyme, C-terminal [Fusarium oxysporum f. sp. vasinfectum]|nr:Mandelate racemase/muconate lactonizing enzyme, C-terminal [Fusarium oxysporum f. sp. vasinfectum]
MGEITITGWKTRDVRFPTSLDGTGSDAMNAAGNYSSAYCILETDSEYTGHGMTFTIGRGNDIVCAAINHVAERLKGRTLSSLVANWGQTWRHLVNDSQLRWIGPEKGVIHLALGAVVNAVWDLWAKTLNKPVWRIVADMSPEEFEAVAMLKEQEPTKAKRLEEALNNRAVPAYTTSAGWLGYGEDKMKSLLQETLNAGYRHFKVKVGGDIERDRKRLGIAREVIGYDKGNVLMTDANQVWSVPEAIEYMKQLADFKPWFIEEPTSPDDVLGHKAVRDALKPYGIGVATGEMCQNRVIFKQLLQTGAIDVCQIDACRMGGVNEVLAVLLMAKKFGVPIVPHSGGVGLPEYTQHLSTIDYVVVSGKLSVLEYVDHLHEHFFHPSVIKDGYYTTPVEPGYSVEMKPESMDRFSYPGEKGVSWWTSDEAKVILDGEKI